MTSPARPTRPPNRLARESSPYLLQHAHNPVDWFTWGPEAISEARRRNVPLFVSIGYSTCYWCHVMERESFENEAIGQQMSEQFVCVKVDREERPDLDDVFMAAVQMLTGHGGWPMNVFVEPTQLRPFWGGTYFPPVPARGMPSFPQVLQRMSDAWANRPEEVLKQAESVATAIAERLAANSAAPVMLGAEQVGMAVQTLLTIYDRTDGGFGRAPKFPQPVYAQLLLQVREHLGDEAHKAAVDHALRHTLDRMALGGMFDQVGGGFHRYSVDTYWLVPHFEKMLYDNAQLLSVYVEASRVYNDAFYARIARRTADYVLREMTQSTGAFSTAQDAEVDGREGLNYLWTPGEMRALLGDDAELALDLYGLNSGTNFTDPHHPSEPASNVLRLSARIEQEALRVRMSEPDLQARLDVINARLYAARQHRKQPRLDDKVLTSWNGLMIGALARAGRELNEPRYTKAAQRAADWLLANHTDATLGLLRTSRVAASGQSTPKIAASLEDYAMLAEGLLEIGTPQAEAGARRLVTDALERFAAPTHRPGERAGLRGVVDAQPQPGEPALFIQPRSTYDGAMPSGVSVLINVLVTLMQREASATSRQVWFDHATRLLASISTAIAESPIATANSTRALLRLMVADAPTLDAAQASLGATPARAGDDPRADPSQDHGIEILSSADEVFLDADTPAELTLRIVIPPGVHINDAFAGDGSGGTMIPLRLSIIGGTGVNIYADFPRGTPLADAKHRVHTGQIEFPVALELAGEWTGAPQIALTFQACTDRACFAPKQVVLDVRVSRIETP